MSAVTQNWDPEDTSDAKGERGLYFSGDLLEDKRALSFFLLLLVPFQLCHHCSKVMLWFGPGYY